MYGERLDNLMRRIHSLMPGPLKNACGEAERFARSRAHPVLQKMNLVSREEYDIQVSLVKRLSEQLCEMQSRIDELEAQDRQSENPASPERAAKDPGDV